MLEVVVLLLLLLLLRRRRRRPVRAAVDEPHQGADVGLGGLDRRRRRLLVQLGQGQVAARTHNLGLVIWRWRRRRVVALLLRVVRCRVVEVALLFHFLVVLLLDRGLRLGNVWHDRGEPRRLRLWLRWQRLRTARVVLLGNGGRGRRRGRGVLPLGVLVEVATRGERLGAVVAGEALAVCPISARHLQEEDRKVKTSCLTSHLRDYVDCRLQPAS